MLSMTKNPEPAYKLLWGLGLLFMGLAGYLKVVITIPQQKGDPAFIRFIEATIIILTGNPEAAGITGTPVLIATAVVSITMLFKRGRKPRTLAKALFFSMSILLFLTLCPLLFS